MPVLEKAEHWIINPPKVKSLEESYKRCKRIARKHYENFPVGSLLIPRRLQRFVFALYAFARTADDFADEPGYSDAERMLYLNEWEGLFLKSLDSNTRHPIMWAVTETIRAHELPKSLFLDLLSAFKQDVTTKRYETFDDLLDYCQRSANPIGRLMLLIFGYRDHRLLEFSDSICTALQLTNFWQDVSVDILKNRVYIPQEDMLSYNVREDMIAKKKLTKGFKNLIRFELERTSALFQMGDPILKHLQGRLRLEIKGVLTGGRRILRKIEKLDYDVVNNRPKLSFFDIFPLLHNFLRKSNVR